MSERNDDKRGYRRVKRMPYRERRHRLPPECYRGEVTVSVTIDIRDSEQAFIASETVTTFIALLTKAMRTEYCRVLVYCFMPEHLHLVLRGRSGDSDALAAVSRFKQQTGYWLHVYTPYRWQKDFHDHIIRFDEDLDAHIRYIANNPVRRGLADTWDSYPFTGAIDSDLAATMEGLLATELQVLRQRYSWRPEPVCPIAWRYESAPRQYLWNATLSGRKLKDVEALQPPQAVLSCPYHDGRDGLLRIEITTAQLGDLEKPFDARDPIVPKDWPKLQ